MSSVPRSTQQAEPRPTVALSQLARGAMARLVALDEPGEAGDRLLEMGLTPGTSLRVVRTGLFGDPLQIEVRGYMLTLRRAQASHIVVEPT